MKIKQLYELLAWAKGQGYTECDKALQELSFLTNENLAFERTVWSGGEYYDVVENEKK